MPSGYQDDLSVGQLYGFLGSESERVVVRTYDVPLGRRSRSRQHADEPSVPTSKPIAPFRNDRSRKILAHYDPSSRDPRRDVYRATRPDSRAPLGPPMCLVAPGPEGIAPGGSAPLARCAPRTSTNPRGPVPTRL